MAGNQNGNKPGESNQAEQAKAESGNATKEVPPELREDYDGAVDITLANRRHQYFKKHKVDAK